MEGRDTPVEALVSPDVEEVMLGIDFLRSHKCIWDFDSSKLYIDGRPAIALSRKRTLRCRRIFVEGDVVIPPHSETDVSARSTLLTPNLAGPDCIVETHQVRPGLYVGRTLLPSSHRDAKVRVCNTTNEPVSVADGTCIGNLSSVTVFELKASERVNSEARPFSSVKNSENANSETGNSLASNAKTTDEVLYSLMSKLPDDLSEAEQDKIEQLLTDFSDIFFRVDRLIWVELRSLSIRLIRAITVPSVKASGVSH